MIDLHMHSNYSADGTFSPKDLVYKCSQNSLTYMSVTDHNCINATPDAALYASKNHINYIPGIEIDCTFQNLNFHVLGYRIDFYSIDFKKIEENIKKQSLKASYSALKKTQELGFYITEDDMWAISKDAYWKEMWTGELFAEVLLKKEEYKDHPRLLPYRTGGERSDNPFVNFYWDFYAQNKPCYTEIIYPSMREIIDLIHQNHGIAILAHPFVNLSGHEALMDSILDLELDGLEAFSSYHSPKQADYLYQ